MAMMFRDNADKYIAAFDFDGTITQDNAFPKIGTMRKYAKEVINLLHDMGVIVLIWTCRDKAPNPNNDICDYMHDDIAPMVEYLRQNCIRYHAINTCIEYAPFYYEARKIYAHMYVDDRAFGWVEKDDIMIDVLVTFMTDVMHIDPMVVARVANDIRNGRNVDGWAVKNNIY